MTRMEQSQKIANITQSLLSHIGHSLLSEAPIIQQRRFYFVSVAAILALWFCTIKSVPVFPIDDAYITLHNAQTILAGKDTNFPGVSPLCGATSAVHLALVALFGLFIRPVWALSVVGWLSIIVYVLGLARLAFIHRASITTAALFVASSLMLALTPHQLMNGLETGLAMAAITWTLVYASDMADARNQVLPILCGTIPFIRPELIAISIFLLSLRCYQHWSSPKVSKVPMRSCAVDLLLAAAAMFPWIIWYWTSTGAPYPLTIAAKRAFFAEANLPAAVKTGWIMSQLSVFAARIGVLGIAAIGLFLSRCGRVALMFSLAFIGCYWMQCPGSLSHYEQRYLYILIPLILYGVLVLISHRSRYIQSGAVVLLALSMCQSLYNFPSAWHQHEKGIAFTKEELAPIAIGCNANLPKNAVLLVHDVGYISYATDFEIVDLVGLKTPSSIADHLHYTLPSVGSRRWDAINNIALRSKADYLIVLKGWERIFGIAYGLQLHGWKLRLLNDKNAAYQVYAITRP